MTDRGSPQADGFSPQAVGAAGKIVGLKDQPPPSAASLGHGPLPHRASAPRTAANTAAPSPPAAACTGGRDLGAKLRQRRKAEGLTMQQVATAAGLSVGFISQVERGLAAPSLSSLAGIAAALSAPIHAFLTQPEACVDLTRAASRVPYAIVPAGRSYERLSTTFPGSTLRAVLIHQPPGPPSLPFSHDGEEMIMVLRGSTTVELDGVASILSEGDCVHFASARMHRCWNHSDRETTLLWCGTMDLFGDDIRV